MQNANPKSTVAPRVHHLNFGMIHCLFRIPHYRVHQVNCGDLICCSWGCCKKCPFLFFVHTAPGFQLWVWPPSACRSPEGIFWEVWGLLPAFSSCSVGIVLHVDVVLMYLWGGRWSQSLTTPPSWRHPHTWWVLKGISRKCDKIQNKANSIPDLEFMWFFKKEVVERQI